MYFRTKRRGCFHLLDTLAFEKKRNGCWQFAFPQKLPWGNEFWSTWTDLQTWSGSWMVLQLAQPKGFQRHEVAKTSSRSAVPSSCLRDTAKVFVELDHWGSGWSHLSLDVSSWAFWAFYRQWRNTEVLGHHRFELFSMLSLCEVSHTQGPVNVHSVEREPKMPTFD